MTGTMRIGLVNLITRTADIDGGFLPRLGQENLAPRTDRDLNIVEMGRRLASRGHEVNIYISDAYRPRVPSDRIDGVEIVYVRNRLGSLFPPAVMPFTPSLTSRVSQDRLDVVQSGEMFQLGTLLSWLGSRGGGPRLFVWQELDVLMRGLAGVAQAAYYQTLGRAVARGASYLIPRSLSARGHLIRQGHPEERISPVVHSGVDTEEFRPIDKNACRARFGLEGAERVILAVGRLHPNKGYDLLIRSMTRVTEELPSSVLVIKGSGPSLDELRKLSSGLGLDGNVRIVSDFLSQEEMAILYNSADLYAVSSRVDLFPFAAIEAISCGVPLATCFGRGLRTDIVDMGAGMMIPFEPFPMGDALASLLLDDAKLRSLGRRGRSLALESFDFEVCADRLISIYEGASP